MQVMCRDNEDTRRLTRADIENPDIVERVLEQDFAFMDGVPNSMQYWHRKNSELFAMIRQLGKPTMFLTLCASEIHWPDLLTLLKRLKITPHEVGADEEDMGRKYAATLVNDDPATCVIYFDHMVRMVMNILQNQKISPFKPYHVVERFKRIEFQHRGSAHAHILVWLNNAPDEAVENGGMPHTVSMATHLLSLDHEVLARPRCQLHQHMHTCYKRYNKTCRFHVPFWPVRETTVLTGLPVPGDEADEKERKHYAFLKKCQTMHEVLDSTEYPTFEAMWDHPGVRDYDDYIQIIRAGLARPTLMLKQGMTRCE